MRWDRGGPWVARGRKVSYTVDFFSILIIRKTSHQTSIPSLTSLPVSGT